MEKGKVSIIIPTFNRSNRIGRAIKSALKQEYDNFEVIVVDDNNPNTEERLQTEKEVDKFLSLSNFKYIQHDINRNGSAARNTGFRNSEGEFITYLDDDDEYYPQKISIQSEILKKLDSSWGICYTNYDKIDQFGNKQTSSETAEGDVLVQSLTKNLFLGSGSNFMVRRSVVEELKGFDETFQRNQDVEFLARVLMRYKIKHISENTFLIHNEIREKKFSYQELIQIHNKYRENFKSFINTLNINEQAEINKTLDLWDIRAAISNKHVKKAIKLLNNSNLSYYDLCKYTWYILKRFLTKKSYGFKL